MSVSSYMTEKKRDRYQQDNNNDMLYYISYIFKKDEQHDIRGQTNGGATPPRRTMRCE